MNGGSVGKSVFSWPSASPLAAAANFLFRWSLVDRLVSGVSSRQSSVTVLSQTADWLSTFSACTGVTEDT